MTRTEIHPIRLTDMGAITRITFANMTGVDQSFTRLMKNPFYRQAGRFIWPVYFLLAGKGYKAVRGKTIIGCAYLNIREMSGYVFNVSVLKHYRRQGVGRQLMKYLEELAWQSGRRWMALQVDDGNQAAMELYSNLGYRAYHPYFFRRTSPGPVAGVTNGLQLESLNRSQGRRLYSRFLDIERRQGDGWAMPIVREYGLEIHEGQRFWQILFHGEGLGCLCLDGSQEWPLIKIATKPDHWDHVNIGGIIRLLQEKLTSPPIWLDVRFGSSTHHDQAKPWLTSLGFRVCSRPRILMLKSLQDQ